MVTINTVEDLIAAIKSDPQLLEQVQRAILTDKLLALPEQFTGMLRTQEEMLRTQESMLRTQDAMLAEIADLRKIQNEILQRLGNVETHNRRPSNDFGAFRGNYAEFAARRDAYGIALGICERRSWMVKVTDVAILGQKDLVQLADDGRFDALPAATKISFLKTDVAICFATSEGTDHYIMVEASYTCDSRDTARAMAHSRMLSQYTGIETFPVISGVRFDREIQPLIDSGDVFWYPIEEQIMEPEEPN